MWLQRCSARCGYCAWHTMAWRVRRCVPRRALHVRLAAPTSCPQRVCHVCIVCMHIHTQARTHTCKQAGAPHLVVQHDCRGPRGPADARSGRRAWQQVLHDVSARVERAQAPRAQERQRPGHAARRGGGARAARAASGGGAATRTPRLGTLAGWVELGVPQQHDGGGLLVRLARRCACAAPLCLHLAHLAPQRRACAPLRTGCEGWRGVACRGWWAWSLRAAPPPSQDAPPCKDQAAAKAVELGQ